MEGTAKTPEEGEVCDFCSDTPVVKVYDAAPILFAFAIQPQILHALDTKWSACAICAKLIDQNLWTDLTDRAMETWLAKQRSHGVHIGCREQTEIKEEIHRMHASFREAKGRTA